MAVFTSTRRNFTPSATENWSLFADAANDHAQIISVHWGGGATSSQPAATRWGHATTNGTAPSTTGLGLPQNTGTDATTPGCTFCTTTSPVIVAAPSALHEVDWNAFGGLGRYFMDLEEGWRILNGITNRAQLICVNDAGTAAAVVMSAGVVWRE